MIFESKRFSFSVDPEESVYERPIWWIKRSLSEEYQKAYDVIADNIPLKQDQVLLEVASGPGEMIKRIYGRVRKIFAVDISPEMLLWSLERLKEAGIPVKFLPFPQNQEEFEREVENPRVALMRVDIFDHPFPNDVFDHTLFTFPDFRTAHPEGLMFMSQEGEIASAPEEYLDTIKARTAASQAVLNLAYLVKRGGIISFVEYGYQSQGFEYVRGGVEPALSVRKFRFFEETRIREDTGGIPLLTMGDFGYRISVCGKKMSTEGIRSLPHFEIRG